MKRLTLLLLWLCGSLLAEEPKPKPAPVIPAEVEIRYWRRMQKARLSAEQAKADADDVTATAQEIIKACGDTHQPQDSVDAKGVSLQRFKCEPKPPAVGNKPKTPQ